MPYDRQRFAGFERIESAVQIQICAIFGILKSKYRLWALGTALEISILIPALFLLAKKNSFKAQRYKALPAN